MQRLSGLDASFLYIEMPSQPLHVCSILELDTSTMPGGYTFDRLHDELALRIEAMPEFREKLADSPLNLDHPVWVDDDDFDLDRHLHRIGLPSPGGRGELAEICGHIAALPLDRSRPLWEMWVIEGVAGTDPREGGRLAVMTKVHHAAVDGVTGANLLSQLCSVEPDAPPPEPVEGAGSAHPLADRGERPGEVRLPPVAAGQSDADDRRNVVEDAAPRASGLTMAAPFAAPATAFNASVTADRNVALAQLDLEDIKTVKDRFEVKVNDVVMALCAAVLRWYLGDHDELPDPAAGGDGAGVGARKVRPSRPQPGVGHVLQTRDAHWRPRGAADGPSPGRMSLLRSQFGHQSPHCCRTGRNSPPGRCSAPSLRVVRRLAADRETRSIT